MKVLLCFETHLLAEGIKKIMLQLADDVQFQLSQPSPATQTDILETEFDLLILDADAQDFDSVEILRGIKKRSPEKKVLFVCEKLGRTVLHA